MCSFKKRNAVSLRNVPVTLATAQAAAGVALSLQPDLEIWHRLSNFLISCVSSGLTLHTSSWGNIGVTPGELPV